ncbi:MAG: hypothetical protein ACI4TR_06745, partial [Bacteroidaceae bacterium]
NHRRKMMRGSINPLLSQLDNQLRQANPECTLPDHTSLLATEIFTKRPEQLDVADFILLTNTIKKHYDNAI